jgi:hypothetical protein
MISVELPGERFFEPVGARRGRVDSVAVEHEHVDKALADGLLVFDDQYVYLPIHQLLRLAPRDMPVSESM